MPNPPTVEVRRDIQGLRAVAVLAVVLYHAHVPFITGGFIGVDVFFVISGFLITRHLLKSLHEGTFVFGAFYARRVRRLLPASVAVLLATVACAAVFLSPLDLARVLREALWTGLYGANILFAVDGTDYLAPTEPSLFQHYWSLGVEEQFYLLWPPLLWAVYRLSRRITVVFWCVAVLCAASVAWSAWLTEINQPLAFFLLPTRAWELGAGALIAAAPFAFPAGSRMRTRRIPVWARTLLGLGALTTLVVCVLRFDGALSYPSAWAAIPVAATAVIIACGPYRGLVAWVLQNPVFVWVGLVSYSVYLIHWPLLTLPVAARSWMVPLTLGESLTLAALSLPLGWLSFRFIESPFRRGAGRPKYEHAAPRRPRASWRPLVAAAACGALIATGSVAGTAAVQALPTSADEPAPLFRANTSPVSPDYIGSNLSVELDDAQSESAIPSGNGCNLTTEGPPEPAMCTYGDDESAVSVALVGDSHAAQWAPAFERLTEFGSIFLTAHTRSGCPLFQRERIDGKPETPDCLRWKAQVLKVLQEDPPDLIVVGSSIGSQAMTVESYETGMSDMIAKLPRSSRVVLLRDTPRFPADPVSCLSKNLFSPDRCEVARRNGLQPEFMAADDRLAQLPRVELLDMLDYVCTATCPVVQGNVLVFKDTHHLSRTFTRALAPHVGERLGVSPRSRP